MHACTHTYTPFVLYIYVIPYTRPTDTMMSKSNRLNKTAQFRLSQRKITNRNDDDDDANKHMQKTN